MRKRLKRVGVEETQFCECRGCGTSVTHPPRRCPACGSTEIAVYDL